MACIRLERTIWPVGHGAFYTEQFKNENNDVLFTAVYDCGSEQEKALEKCIKEFLPEKDRLVIDALFISHFHADHVNKLAYLLQENVSVRNLFIPQLTDDYVLSILATSEIDRRRNRTNINLLEQLYNGERIKNVDTIYEVPQINSDYIPEGEYIGVDQATFKYQVAPLAYTDPTIPFWVYIPCNIFSSDPQLVKEFIKAGYGDIDDKKVDVDLVFDALRGGLWKDIQHIYGKVFPKNHNEYSMTVYSGFAPNVISHSIQQNAINDTNAYYQNQPICFPCFYDSILNKEVGGLYTGDFEAKQHGSTLIRFYQQNYNVWDRIRVMQIPHHGSYKDNYYKDLYRPIKLSFASTAINDKYGHPHVQTLANISTMKCPIVIVQDNKATTLAVIYDINI